ncbi:MAG: ABC transporter permease [Cyclobacteriaceae bacterium]|nr:MAG: ABC transporter permease [Cyclobacteriaceae bacterium]
MNKILLVVKREYITRVRKKSFIVMTLLTPLLFAGLIGGLLWIATTEQSEQKVIAVIDDSGLFKDKFQSTDDLNFLYLHQDVETAKTNFSQLGPDGLLYIPKIDIYHPEGIQLYSESNPHFGVINKIENTLEKEIEYLKMKQLGLDQQTLENIETRISLKTLSLTSSGIKASNAEATFGTAYVSSLLIYFFLFLYGVQVMKGVIEEKYNRIIEVIISSIKPFQLMMGKILGIAAVGLTQFLVWVLLSFLVTASGMSLMGLKQDPADLITEAAPLGSESAVLQEAAPGMWEMMESIPFTYVMVTFVIYFLGGYFLYASLFAVVGSAVDSDADSQQFMFPITIPLIISIVALGFVLNDPDGQIAFWMSMIPLTSPVIMLGRIPFGVPFWQLAMSVTLLIGGFIFTTWVAGRIYRVGILTHGSKVNYKTLTKWFFQNY